MAISCKCQNKYEFLIYRVHQAEYVIHILVAVPGIREYLINTWDQVMFIDDI